jgi:hypothetical protein
MDAAVVESWLERAKVDAPDAATLLGHIETVC